MYHMEESDFEDHESVIIDGDEETVDAGEENVESPLNRDRFEDFTRNGMIVVGEGNMDYQRLKRAFIQGMGTHGEQARILAIHRNFGNGFSAKARIDAFRIFLQAVARKCGGNPNMKIAWYGASRAQICGILTHGFSQFGATANDASHGIGVYLFPYEFSVDCLASTRPDEDGVRHMLLCSVIMGKMEVVPAGSNQSHPSSTEFDCGVDDLAEPRKYIVWSSFMNSHIFPQYIISFKVPSYDGLRRELVIDRRPISSPQVSMNTLFHALLKTMDPPKMALIKKCYNDFENNKITRLQMTRRIRQIVGDDMILVVAKAFRDKLLVGPSIIRSVRMAALAAVAAASKRRDLA